ncbi:uncharacterized protein LOC120675713 isoform X1 [Panicum virgatum]|uniref:uncharacterized protein LOC120675713 isoform X1 n=1 Tax=Panicum virgatum TaxID=38727 RepID=UPI0019D59DCB|nr:uncharacterized protein LOC120675713 isoform X1 [Panicum virgatum]
MDSSSSSDQNAQSSKDKNAESNSKDGPSINESDDSALSPRSKLKDCTKFSTQFSLAKMVKLIEKLSPRQRDSVIKCGFGSILALKCTSIPNSLILWTAKNYDPKSRHFKAAGGTVGVLSKLMQSLCTKFLVFHMEENKCPINHPAMPKCHPQRYKSTESSCKD